MYKFSRSHDQDGRHGYILKLDMKHRAMELYKVCINHDPGITLTFFTARST